ncbi:MAG: energy transducer TonB [Opitutales bacterium]
MKLPRDQPFWTSVILHLVVLLALFLATIIETLKPKEKPHVFEMISPPTEQTSAAAPSPAPPLPEIQLPDLEPVPELAEMPKPVAPAPKPMPPAPKPPPTPAPAKPELTTMDDFIRQHGTPQPRQSTRPPAPRPTLSAPRIEVPKLVLPANPSASASSERPLTQQQMSALGTYSAQLRSRIDAAWAKPASLAGVNVAATVVFDVSASGRITNARLRPGSGNSAFDQSVLAAFRKVVSAGPTPTGQGHSFSMTFRMTD